MPRNSPRPHLAHGVIHQPLAEGLICSKHSQSTPILSPENSMDVPKTGHS
jgi:hypothetical protein